MTTRNDILLSDGRHNKKFALTLNGKNAIQETSLSEDQFAAVIRSTGKKFGDFDEQRNWKGGRGVEYFNDNPDGYFDSKNCWTLSQGSLMPTLQMKFAKDIRSQDFVTPGSVTWKALLGADKYLDVSFSASSSYSAAHIYLWIRRVGRPGTLTVKLCADSGGEPDTVLKTITVTASDITDTLSVQHDFVPDSVQALTSGTTYHIKVYAGTDSAANHWEIGTGVASGLRSTDDTTWTATAYAPYYRITDADVKKVWYSFIYDDAMYVVDSKDSGAASVLFINGDRGLASSGGATSITQATKSWTSNMWTGAFVRIKRGTGLGQVREIVSNTSTALTIDPAWDVNPDNTSLYVIYATNRFTELTGHGLGKVVSCPVVSNDNVYFPQGATIMRVMNYTSAGAHQYAADATSYKAYYLATSTDSVDGPQLWRVDDTLYQVSRANAVSWGSNLTFKTAIPIGSTHYRATGMLLHSGIIYVFKEDSVWTIQADKAREEPYGISATPDIHNGQASATHNLFMYFSWLWSTERLYGGTLDDVGMDWKGIGLPDDRQGFASKYEPAVGWLFQGVDAGNEGTSSVLCYDGLYWHEILRGFKAGLRVRNVKWQPCDGTRHRLWTSIGSDLVYQVFPLNTANPLNDSSCAFEHEGVFVSSTIDMGAASRLPKYIKGLTLLTKNLSTSGMSVGMSYQVDNDIGTDSWVDVSPGFYESPEQELKLNIANVRQFRYRLILNTATNTTPVVVKSAVPSGFARVPFRRVWHFEIKTGEIYDNTGKKNVDPQELKDWLRLNASYPGIIHMESRFEDVNDHYVIISPPGVLPKSNDKDIINFSVMEI